LNESVRKVSQRIDEDGHEQHAGAAQAVAQHAPEDAAQHQAEHLDVDDEESAFKRVGHAEVVERRNAHDAEEQQVVDVHKVAQRGDPHGGVAHHRCRLHNSD
jgi:hypothetical protein